jgi:hypothetical protein
LVIDILDESLREDLFEILSQFLNAGFAPEAEEVGKLEAGMLLKSGDIRSRAREAVILKMKRLFKSIDEKLV